MSSPALTAIGYEDHLVSIFYKYSTRLRRSTRKFSRANHYYEKYSRKMIRELIALESDYSTHMAISDDEDDEEEYEWEYYREVERVIHRYTRLFRKRLIGLSS